MSHINPAGRRRPPCERQHGSISQLLPGFLQGRRKTSGLLGPLGWQGGERSVEEVVSDPHGVGRRLLEQILDCEHEKAAKQRALPAGLGWLMFNPPSYAAPTKTPQQRCCLQGAAVSLPTELSGKNRNMWCLRMTSKSAWVRGARENVEREAGSVWEGLSGGQDFGLCGSFRVSLPV